MLNSIEQAGAWPSPLSSALGAAIPKGAGGDRVLGLAPTPRQSWSKVRAKYSALRAALIRAAMDEGANALSFEHATLFLDLTRFCGSAGLNIGLPAIILLLILLCARACEERPYDFGCLGCLAFSCSWACAWGPGRSDASSVIGSGP
eukprot:3071181-Pyramimonas_sp.AAC.1